MDFNVKHISIDPIHLGSGNTPYGDIEFINRAYLTIKTPHILSSCEPDCRFCDYWLQNEAGKLDIFIVKLFGKNIATFTLYDIPKSSCLVGLYMPVLYVHDNYTSNKLGSTLLKLIIEGTFTDGNVPPNIVVPVQSGNEKAKKFFRAKGFEEAPIEILGYDDIQYFVLHIEGNDTE